MTDAPPFPDPATLYRLDGKVAVVTGATKGLGRAIAQGLSAAGAKVVVSSRKQELCDAAAAEITAATGGETFARACHVGEWDEIPGFVDDVVERFGGVDVLVNNAGINPGDQSVSDTTLSFWRKVYSVNVEGPLRTSQVCAPIMRERGGGSIVNIATVGAYAGGPGVAAYGSSKAALINLTKTMAKEWAPWGVRVNAVSPGPFKSELTRAANEAAPGWFDHVGGITMLGRVAETEEIVGPILYLASPASSYVTGEDHVVSGGMLRSG